jgi:hypothetical protein
MALIQLGSCETQGHNYRENTGLDLLDSEDGRTKEIARNNLGESQEHHPHKQGQGDIAKQAL